MVWTKDDEEKFILAVQDHGSDYEKISKRMGNRTSGQCYYHSKKII